MLYLCGDTHGWLDVEKLRRYFILQSLNGQLNKKDILVILGDTAIGWNNTYQYTNKLYEFYNNLGIEVVVVGGNHDNYNFLDALPKVRKFGSSVGKIHDGIYYLNKGKVYNLNGIKAFVFGGAHQIDIVQSCRVENIDWWRHEDPTFMDTEIAFESLQKCNNTVDLVLTHTLPKSIVPLVLGRYSSICECNTQDFLEHIREQVQFKHWFAGHFHVDKHIVTQQTNKYRSDNLSGISYDVSCKDKITKNNSYFVLYDTIARVLN